MSSEGWDVVSPQPTRTRPGPPEPWDREFKEEIVLERTYVAQAAFDRAIGSVVRGVKQAERGDLVDLGSFAAVSGDPQAAAFKKVEYEPEFFKVPEGEAHEIGPDGGCVSCPGEPTGNPKDAIGDTKPQIHLVPPAGLIYTAKVMELGARKYGPYNWREQPVRRTVYLSALLRHALRALDGEEVDPESGMPHEAHIAACAAIILDAMATGNLLDDRPIPGAAGRLIEEMTERAA